MNDLIELWENPSADEKYMIAGWQQWADAGSISSGLPQYLVDQTQARKVGEIKPYGFYLFQLPGTHHFLRPEVKLEEGYNTALTARKNEIFYKGDDQKGLFFFLGDEPHLNAEEYADAFFDMVEELGVKRVAAMGGVYGAMPYDKDRNVSCSYSLSGMKEDLSNYAVRFSNYQGGATIGSYMLNHAEERGIEFFVFNAMVPAYDFSELSSMLQGIRIDNDYKAWYDLMTRLNHMFGLDIDLTELQRQSDEVMLSMANKISELSQKAPQTQIEQYMEQVDENFTEKSFMPLDDVWERELGDLLDDMEN